MITGASKSNVAIILVDARKGISEQTRRRSFIAKFIENTSCNLCGKQNGFNRLQLR